MEREVVRDQQPVMVKVDGKPWGCVLQGDRNRTPGNVVLGRVRHPETVRRVQVHLERVRVKN
jgi:hypothetical protein